MTSDVVHSAGQHGPQYVMVPDVVPSVGQHGAQYEVTEVLVRRSAAAGALRRH